VIDTLTEATTATRVDHPLTASRSTQRGASAWALCIALLLHVSVIVLLPDTWLPTQPLIHGDDAEPLEVTLLPPEPISPQELQYVEANPDAPENAPDRTDQYSFRNQQAASHTSNDALPEAPHVDGEEDSHKIVQGAQQQPAPLPPGVYTPSALAGQGPGNDGDQAGAPLAVPVAAAQPLAAPEFLQQTPVSEDGPGSRLETPGPARELLPNPQPEAPINVYQPSAQTAVTQVGHGNGGAVEAKPMPRTRPRLAPELVQGPLMRSRGSVSRRGTLAIDATFSEFGEYQQQFYAALQAGWYQEIEFFQPIDTAARVVVGFLIKADGSIHDVEVLQTTAGEIATLICQTAITKRSPFRPWTREMVQVFGDERTLRVAFHYR
jgi:hypothetical protein